MCAVRDFTLAHKFPRKTVPVSAVQLQEMGINGTGSSELGDASGEIFWMPYMPTFLQYYYDTFPELLPKSKGDETPVAHQGAVDDATTPKDEAAPIDASKPDVHPDFPHVRLCKAPVMSFFTLNKDTLVEMGPHSGQYRAQFQCIIHMACGRACGALKEITHKDGRAVSTSNLINHLRQHAPKCEKHKEALALVEASSKNCVGRSTGRP